MREVLRAADTFIGGGWRHSGIDAKATRGLADRIYFRKGYPAYVRQRHRF